MSDNVSILAGQWGVEIANQIAGAAKAEFKRMTCSEFLDHCTACGGNWGGMLLTGIRKLFPTVWDLIPEHMGLSAFACICCVMELCGVYDE